MKLKTRLSLSLTEKLLHTIKSNDDEEVAFDKYITNVTHKTMIYVESEQKYIPKRSEDGEAKPSRGSSCHREVESQLIGDKAIVAIVDAVLNKS